MVFSLLGILLVGSVYFYKERMLFLDAAHIAFSIINTGHLQIQEDRNGAIITQIIPLIATKLHLPLKAILLLYSTSFVFIFIIAALFLYRLRQTTLLILLGCYCTLFAGATWFWTNNEIHQGIAILLIAYGWLYYCADTQKPPILAGILFLPIAWFAIFTHPLVMTAAAFLWLYYLLEKGALKKNKTIIIILTAILICIIYAKVKSSQGGWYDGDKMNSIFGMTTATIVKAAGNPMAVTFLHKCITQFWLLTATFIAGCAMLLRQRKYWLLAGTIATVIAFYFLLCLTYDEYIPFYIESEWMPLAIIAALPFATYLLPALKPRIAAALLGVMFAIQLLYIAGAAPQFRNRIAFMNRNMDRMQQKGITKLIIPTDKRLEDTLIMTWGLPVETLMLSAIEHRSPQLTLRVNPPNNDLHADGNTTFISTFESLKYAQLNPRYFHPDSTQPYQIIPYDTFVK